MKKILTITCHNVYNHGATLQQWALLEYLKLLGFDAKTINYKPDYLSNHYNLWTIANPKFGKNFIIKALYLIAKLPVRLLERQRKRNFDEFESKNLAVHPKKYQSNNDLKLDLPKANFYITGSDQVWNSFFENGKDPAFYLDFVPDILPKLSFAASFAIDEIDDNLKSFVKEKVGRLHAISVREQSGVKILQNLNINDAVQVLDPVFLLDANYWKEKFVKPINEDFIFVYDFDSNAEIKKTAQFLAKKYNLKIHSVNQKINYASNIYRNSAPDEFLSLVFSAKHVLTNSFHAVAFSLIFNKNFLVFNRAEKINARMHDLLSLVNLDHLLIDGFLNIDFQKAQIDYSLVNKILIDKILFSKLFLADALR